MPGLLDLAVIAFGAAIFIAWLCILEPYRKNRRNKKKLEQLTTVARELDLSFSYYHHNCWYEANDVQGKDGIRQIILNKLYYLHLFKQDWGGEDSIIDNVLHGELRGGDFACFDYTCVDEDEGNTQTVVYFSSPELNLPMFAVRPENIFHKISEVFGYQKVIDFPSHPDFSKKYLLRGTDKKRIQFLFDHDLRTFVNSLNGICVEGEHKSLICYRAGKQVNPKNVKAFINEGSMLFTHFCSSSKKFFR